MVDYSLLNKVLILSCVSECLSVNFAPNSNRFQDKLAKLAHGLTCSNITIKRDTRAPNRNKSSRLSIQEFEVQQCHIYSCCLQQISFKLIKFEFDLKISSLGRT